ncbi:GCN5-related N-acetyltransferase [Pseudodesulfovibrio mercurii]|uniref:GCN5-related N-acetyltransferase n=1 Tax=Pseudodesulfovibrio mercurii TaxID=641491 RepID=F0JKK4_9BACT|nr:GNAT family N-acetyltransferase [Pseudodesulfovibrio mercurii]EGB16453.1 GCN5-related N-acetyltransferase [Pseudodesulfovibrio mercurii]
MAADIIYELLTPEREEQARDLVREVFAAFVAPGFSSTGRIAFEAFLCRSSFSRRSGRGFALAARRAGGIVGVIDVADGGHVALFFVSGEHRGRGVGRTLMRLAGERCLRDLPTPGRMTVNASPGSVGAYAAMGFVPAGGEEERDGIRFVPMVLALDEPEKPAAP